MYKVDGSISSLVLFFTKDFLEVNCAVDRQSEVKQKWRITIHEVIEIISYEEGQPS